MKPTSASSKVVPAMLTVEVLKRRIDALPDNAEIFFDLGGPYQHLFCCNHVETSVDGLSITIMPTPRSERSFYDNLYMDIARDTWLGKVLNVLQNKLAKSVNRLMSRRLSQSNSEANWIT